MTVMDIASGAIIVASAGSSALAAAKAYLPHKPDEFGELLRSSQPDAKSEPLPDDMVELLEKIPPSER